MIHDEGGTNFVYGSRIKRPSMHPFHRDWSLCVNPASIPTVVCCNKKLRNGMDSATRSDQWVAVFNQARSLGCSIQLSQINVLLYSTKPDQWIAVFILLSFPCKLY
ncbi:hypothetical protein OTU49_007752, partial [Cherax quadricarinatus]